MTDMKAQYIKHMGDDLDIVDCARVSFDKASNWIHRDQVVVPHLKEGDLRGAKYDAYLAFMDARALNTVVSFADWRLLHHLITARPLHFAPMTHQIVRFRIEVPVAIGAQLKRSTVGLALSEVSRRYVSTPPSFYTPDKWRAKPEASIKQGSDPNRAVHEISMYGEPTNIGRAYAEFLGTANTIYSRMIEAGVAPEMARFVLPQSMHTTWMWTGSLFAWARICKLRSGHAQDESQQIAREISAVMQELFPAAWPLLMDGPALD